MKVEYAEDRFIIASLRCFLSEGPPPLPSEARGVDWARFAARARSQRVEGAIWWGLAQRGAADLLPPQIAETFQSVYYAQTGRFVFLVNETQSLVEALYARNVPAICLKGIALAPENYPTPGARPMSDIDVLVPEDEAHVAEDILHACGYRPAPEIMPEDWEKEIHHHATPFVRGEIEFEIHRNLVTLSHPVAGQIQTFWQRARSLSAVSPHALRLCRSDMLFHLCLHCGFRWTGAQLLNLLDLHILLQTEGDGLNWHAFVRHGQRRDVARQMYYPLAIAEFLFGPRVPRGVMRALHRKACPSRLELKHLLELALSTAAEKTQVPLTLRLAQSEAICSNTLTSARWVPYLVSLIAPPAQTYPRLQQEAPEHPLTRLVRYTTMVRTRLAHVFRGSSSRERQG